jgi:hypothetical protein
MNAIYMNLDQDLRYAYQQACESFLDEQDAELQSDGLVPSYIEREMVAIISGHRGLPEVGRWLKEMAEDIDQPAPLSTIIQDATREFPA